MKTILYTEARNHLDELIERVAEQREPVMILGTKGRKDSVLVTKEDYDNMLENLHVVGRPEWVRSIKRGVSQLDAGKGKRLTLDEALDL